MRFWPSMALSGAKHPERTEIEHKAAGRGVDGGTPGSLPHGHCRPGHQQRGVGRLLDGLVEVEAEAVGGYDEEDAQLLAVVFIHA